MLSILRPASATVRQEARSHPSRIGLNPTGLVQELGTARRKYARRAARHVTDPDTLPGTSSPQPRKRSFLLDPYSKPPSLRASPSRELPEDVAPFERRLASNPYASILATPVRQCLYTRKSLPNAFLTKLIQAASDVPKERPWIVTEGILPHQITREHASNRYGTGRWVYSGPNIMERMIKDGKYKMISSSAQIRPNLAQLVYAQWTIRVASDIVDLCMPTSGPSPVILLENEAAAKVEGSNAETKDTCLTWSGNSTDKLQCVLYFGPPRSDIDSADGNLQNQEDEALIDITQPNLPTLMDRSRVLKTATINGVEKNTVTVPMYAMEHLFHNHSNGLRAIQLACTRRLLHAMSNDQTVNQNSRWIGLVESPASVAAAMGLWKLAAMLPKASPPR
ncbi:hypothetical protein BGX31_004418 [Mortierella sp. GBA43]|nr:hypothetical protein BGX31_004418 [Mortierella sp. GBA43]